MHSYKRILAAALLAGLAPAAHALDLYTPESQAGSGSIIHCVLTNIGTKPITVSADLQDPGGNDITISTKCYAAPSVLDPGKSCYADSGIPGLKNGRCHFTSSSSKVRGVLLVLTATGDALSALPATKY